MTYYVSLIPPRVTWEAERFSDPRPDLLRGPCLRTFGAVLSCKPPQVELGRPTKTSTRIAASIEPLTKELSLSSADIQSFKAHCMLLEHANGFIQKGAEPGPPPKREIEHIVPLKERNRALKQVVYPVPGKYLGKFRSFSTAGWPLGSGCP